jgi:DNA-binding NarL/FixJ family response regulator
MIAPTSPLRLLVADDHPVVRAGIVGLVDAEDDMTVVAQAGDGRGAVEAWLAHRPDVVLMDLHMPDLDGIAAIAHIRAHSAAARILVLTTYGGDARAARALEAGAQGYLLKTMIRTDMLRAIRTVHAGRQFVPEDLAASMKAHADRQTLSTREIEVLRAVAHNGRNKIAAAEMGLSEGTVKVHMKNILAKLHANDRVQALTIALRRGILTLDP